MHGAAAYSIRNSLSSPLSPSLTQKFLIKMPILPPPSLRPVVLFRTMALLYSHSSPISFAMGGVKAIHTLKNVNNGFYTASVDLCL